MIALNVADVVELFQRKAKWAQVWTHSWPYALICAVVESINQAHAREDVTRQNTKASTLWPPYGRPNFPSVMGAQKSTPAEVIAVMRSRIENLEASNSLLRQNHEQDINQLKEERTDHNMTCTQLAHAELRIKELSEAKQPRPGVEMELSTALASIARLRSERAAGVLDLANAQARIAQLVATDEKSTRDSFAMLKERDAARTQAMDARKIISDDGSRIAKMQETMRMLHDTVVRQAEALDNLPRIEQANRDLRAEADARIDQVCDLTAEVKRLQGHTTVREWELMHAEICKALGVKPAPLGTHTLCLNAISTLRRKSDHLALYIAAVNGAMPELPKEPA